MQRKLFSEEFIQNHKISSQPKSPKIFTPLLQNSKVEKIFHYMRELIYDKETNATFCQAYFKEDKDNKRIDNNDRFDYEDLLIEIEKTRKYFSKNKSLQDQLVNLHNAIIKYIDDHYPEFAGKMRTAAVIWQNQIDHSERIRKGAVCGIVCCSLWGLVQQPLTLFNLFRICPEKVKEGELSCCDAPASIAASCHEYKEETRHIAVAREQGPMQHVMR